LGGLDNGKKKGNEDLPYRCHKKMYNPTPTIKKQRESRSVASRVGHKKKRELKPPPSRKSGKDGKPANATLSPGPGEERNTGSPTRKLGG